MYCNIMLLPYLCKIYYFQSILFFLAICHLKTISSSYHCSDIRSFFTKLLQNIKEAVRADTKTNKIDLLSL